jgi:hypothetical protein
MDDVSLAINLQSITPSSIWAGYFTADFSAALLGVSITACPCRNGLGANVNSQPAGVQMTGRDARRQIWQMRPEDLTTLAALQRRLGQR